MNSRYSHAQNSSGSFGFKSAHRVANLKAYGSKSRGAFSNISGTSPYMSKTGEDFDSD